MTPLSVEIDVVVAIDGPVPVEPSQLAALVEYALSAEGASGEWTVAVVLTGDEHLRQLHRDFMGIDEETDVMTFPLSEDGSRDEQGGDIVISVDRAAEQGAEAGQTVADEIRFLAVHGVLHLCGWNDDTSERRNGMHARQTEIIGSYATGLR
ncbi:MAG: putative rRNA maturation factor [Thermomicrobiales bacterium]|jgi:probable rRNA maturation factor|nr:putative rRNA maturation factor [Thermomicrobiales bacterium]